MTPRTPYHSSRAVTGGEVRSGYLGGKAQITRSYLLLKAEGSTGQDGDLTLQALGGFQNTRQGNAGVSISAGCYTGGQPSQTSIALSANPDKKNSIYCEAHDGYFGIDGIGLMVGDCGETDDVPPGEIWADGGFSSDAGVTVVKLTQNSAVAVRVTQDWTTGTRVLADCSDAGLGLPSGYYGTFDAFSADPLWFGKVNISESTAASLGDIYLGGANPQPAWFCG